jgi:oligopeptide/dipeptide ABC transporter ATP-binding protein
MVMYAGKIVEGAETGELFGTMRHPYAEALFESIPRLDQDRSQRLYSIPGVPPDLSKEFVGCRFAPRCRYTTAQCVDLGPLLAPSTVMAPGAGLASAAGGPGTGAPAPSSPSMLGAGWATTPAEHIFACFHPVTATRLERLSFQQGGRESGLAAEPTLGRAPSPGHEAELLEGDLRLGEAVPNGPGNLSRPGRGGRAAQGRADPLISDGPSHADPGQGSPALQVNQLEKQYAVTAGAVMQRVIGTVKAVSNVSFTVRQGATFGLVGESGCGKTTIGRLVVALERPTGGAVHFEGEEISSLRGSRLRRRRRDLQLLFQDPYSSLDPRMRVRSIIREPLRIQHSGTHREQEERISEVLNEVGLSPKAGDLYPHEFSGGQRQRIGLARALALHPKLIVADEPVSALDVSIQAQILNLMRSLQERHNLTYVLISHDLAVVKYLADTIGVMYLGKLVEIGPAEDVYARAAHPYTRGLIDTIPVPDPVLARRRSGAPMRGELPSAMSPPSGCRFRTRCPFAQERCAEEEPALRQFGVGHRAACHFPLQTPRAEEPASVTALSV